MCGIAGMFRTDGDRVAPEDLSRMVAALHHRGPDGSGSHAEGPLGIAMTRLAIIDVAGGQQPILNESGTIALVCNGEIYNYKELRGELERAGHRFRTHGDVEVILHLYEDQGPACFSRLNGMFAAAIADFAREQLVLARDPYGQKPLYIRRTGTGIQFASELKALAALPGFERRVSTEALTEYLQFRYVAAPRTIFQGVEKLPPGSYQGFRRSGADSPQRYFQVDLGPERAPGGPSDPAQVRPMFAQAVQRHLMSERPLGVFLSGGLDSSAIVACMSENAGTQVHTYTVGFEGFLDNEFDTARQVAEKFKTRHSEVVLTGEGYWDALSDIVWSADEPLADLTTVPLYFLAKEARRELVVVLSGEGSDELLAGYPGHEKIRALFDRHRSLQPIAPLALIGAGLPFPDALSRKLRNVGGSAADYLSRSPITMTEVFGESFRARHGSPEIANGDALGPMRRYFAARQGWDGVHLCLGALIEWWLPDDLLHKADRMTMAHSIELRCPFLDKEFSGFLGRLNLDDKVVARSREPNRKIALKRAFADVLPEGIAMQKKKGFAIPMYEWLGTTFRDRARHELERKEGLGSALFQPEVRRDLLTASIAGDELSQRRVWSIIVLNKWGDRWL